MPEQERYESHCPEGDRRGRNYSRRLEQWGKAQARHPPGSMPYEDARRKAQIAARVLDGLCDHCPYAGQEVKPCDK